MSKVQMLRSVVKQRLTAAAEEIFGLFERTIAEYEEELSSSKEENERQRKLLDAVFNPEVRKQRADVQQLLVLKEVVPPEQQDWSSSLDQEDSEPPHIKEEQEELWISQEGEQLQGLEDADTNFSFIPVKSEDDEEEAQYSQLHQNQTEENREAEHLKTEADGEEVISRSDPDSPLRPAADETSQSFECETDDSRDWKKTQEPRSDLNPLQNNEVPVSDVNYNTGNTSMSSSECAGSFGHKGHLEKLTESKTGVKPFKCSVCGKRFARKQYLNYHMPGHTGERPFSCSVCVKKFRRAHTLKQHFTVHTGERPFSCSVCGKKFRRSQTLKRHFTVHTGERPFSCSVCSKTFAQKGHLNSHRTVHTGEKPFSCSVCHKTFTRAQNLKQHLNTHTGKTNESFSF